MTPFLQSPAHLEPHTDDHSPLGTVPHHPRACKLLLAAGRGPQDRLSLLLHHWDQLNTPQLSAWPTYAFDRHRQAAEKEGCWGRVEHRH